MSKADRLPGKTGVDDHSKWTLSVLNMPTGVGYVRRTHKTLSHEEEAELRSDELFPTARPEPRQSKQDFSLVHADLWRVTGL